MQDAGVEFVLSARVSVPGDTTLAVVRAARRGGGGGRRGRKGGAREPGASRAAAHTVMYSPIAAAPQAAAHFIEGVGAIVQALVTGQL